MNRIRQIFALLLFSAAANAQEPGQPDKVAGILTPATYVAYRAEVNEHTVQIQNLWECVRLQTVGACKNQIDDAETTISLVFGKLNEMKKYLEMEETASISFQGQEVSRAGELEAIRRIIPDFETAKQRIYFLSNLLKVEDYKEEYAKLTGSTDFSKVRGIADLNSRASAVNHVVSRLEYGYSIFKSMESYMRQGVGDYFYPEKVQRDDFSAQINSTLSLLEENLVLFRYLDEEINVGKKMEESNAAEKAFIACTFDRPDPNKRCISQARSYYNRIQYVVEAVERMESYIHTNSRLLLQRMTASEKSAILNELSGVKKQGIDFSGQLKRYYNL